MKNQSRRPRATLAFALILVLAAAVSAHSPRTLLARDAGPRASRLVTSDTMRPDSMWRDSTMRDSTHRDSTGRDSTGPDTIPRQQWGKR